MFPTKEVKANLNPYYLMMQMPLVLKTVLGFLEIITVQAATFWEMVVIVMERSVLSVGQLLTDKECRVNCNLNLSTINIRIFPGV